MTSTRTLSLGVLSDSMKKGARSCRPPPISGGFCFCKASSSLVNERGRDRPSLARKGPSLSSTQPVHGKKRSSNCLMGFLSTLWGAGKYLSAGKCISSAERCVCGEECLCREECLRKSTAAPLFVCIASFPFLNMRTLNIKRECTHTWGPHLHVHIRTQNTGTGAPRAEETPGA